MTVALILGLAWSALVASPVARAARRVTVVQRSDSLRRSVPAPRRRSISAGLTRALQAWPVTRVVRAGVLRRAARRDQDAIARELPVTIDLLAVATAAGCTPYLAVETAARWAPPLLGAHLDAVRQACELGLGFGPSLERLAAAVPSLHPFCDAVMSSEQFGAPVADALARLAGEARASLRRRAESRARVVPVHLLFPLIFLVLPAFGLLTVVPALLAGFPGS